MDLIAARVAGMQPDQTHLSSKDFSPEVAIEIELLGETFSVAGPSFWARIEAGMDASQYALFRWKVPLIDMDQDTHEARRILRCLALAQAK
jgi:hypothetical protein